MVGGRRRTRLGMKSFWMLMLLLALMPAAVLAPSALALAIWIDAIERARRRYE